MPHELIGTPLLSEVTRQLNLLGRVLAAVAQNVLISISQDLHVHLVVIASPRVGKSRLEIGCLDSRIKLISASSR